VESTSGKDSILIERGLGRGEMVADMEKEAKRVERDTRVININNDDDDDDDNNNNTTTTTITTTTTTTNNNNNNNESWKRVLFQVIVTILHIRDKK
jgi:hypothetical protein